MITAYEAMRQTEAAIIEIDNIAYKTIVKELGLRIDHASSKGKTKITIYIVDDGRTTERIFSEKANKLCVHTTSVIHQKVMETVASYHYDTSIVSTNEGSKNKCECIEISWEGKKE